MNTPSSLRTHIGLFGMRNAGKSSLMNALTAQYASVVSEIAGTTTDPVSKAMEIMPLGAVLLTDTPGFDDAGVLGEKRVSKALDVLRKTDLALLVVDVNRGMTDGDHTLISLFSAHSIPFFTVFTKAENTADKKNTDKTVFVSAQTGENIPLLLSMLGNFKRDLPENTLLGGIVKKGDRVLLVTPIDEAAPRGRLILPQQETLREILDLHAVASLCQPEELPALLGAARPSLVITDSQVFEKVASLVPLDIPLTSFSILFSRYKGDLASLVRGAKALSALRDGDRVLIAEACTHRRTCSDIGTVKLPRMIEKYTGRKLTFSFTSGSDFPADLSDYSLIVHCGGCMLSPREMKARLRMAGDVPIVNFGVAIAEMHGILARALTPFSVF